ncbi:MAG TPA: CoA pyrophosphatase [Burkholderiales bacterium]|nr:CoA pyrophosphatase [Burkholderiales bacterium]
MNSPFDPSLISQRLEAWLKQAQASGGDLEGREVNSAQRKLTPAAVLVPIIRRESDLTVLFTERAGHLTDHAGQISFPGGRVEPHDPTVEETALRETEEEIGLNRSYVTLLGRLPEYVTGTGFRVTPVVGWIEPGFSLVPDPFEVAEIFEAPLAFFMNPVNHQEKSMFWEGRERRYYAMPYQSRYIWGATAGMLRSLYMALTEPEKS